jgi:hypothetical protein
MTKFRIERLTPWGMSILFHCGVALALAFIVFQTVPGGPVNQGASAGVRASALPRRVTPRPMRTTMVKREAPVRAGEGAADTVGATLGRSIGA